MKVPLKLFLLLMTSAIICVTPSNCRGIDDDDGVCQSMMGVFTRRFPTAKWPPVISKRALTSRRQAATISRCRLHSAQAYIPGTARLGWGRILRQVNRPIAIAENGRRHAVRTKTHHNATWASLMTRDVTYSADDADRDIGLHSLIGCLSHKAAPA